MSQSGPGSPVSVSVRAPRLLLSQGRRPRHVPAGLVAHEAAVGHLDARRRLHSEGAAAGGRAVS